jgi:hypothetical protein
VENQGKAGLKTEGNFRKERKKIARKKIPQKDIRLTLGRWTKTKQNDTFDDFSDLMDNAV